MTVEASLSEKKKVKFLSPAAAFLDSATEDDFDSGAEFSASRSCAAEDGNAPSEAVGEHVIQYISDNIGCSVIQCYLRLASFPLSRWGGGGCYPHHCHIYR